MEPAIDKHTRHLNMLLDRWQQRLPGWAARAMGWLRKPSSRWIRIPVGLLLVASGVLGFLPVLGFWMAIPGLLLLALDVPALRWPARSAIVRGKRVLEGWRRRRQAHHH